MDYSGAILEESRETFATIAAAVAAGTRQLVKMNAIDRTDLLTPPWRARTSNR